MAVPQPGSFPLPVREVFAISYDLKEPANGTISLLNAGFIGLPTNNVEPTWSNSTFRKNLNNTLERVGCTRTQYSMRMIRTRCLH
jgi:hypothetical protein